MFVCRTADTNRCQGQHHDHVYKALHQYVHVLHPATRSRLLTGLEEV